MVQTKQLCQNTQPEHSTTGTCAVPRMIAIHNLFFPWQQVQLTEVFQVENLRLSTNDAFLVYIDTLKSHGSDFCSNDIEVRQINSTIISLGFAL